MAGNPPSEYAALLSCSQCLINANRTGGRSPWAFPGCVAVRVQNRFSTRECSSSGSSNGVKSTHRSKVFPIRVGRSIHALNEVPVPKGHKVTVLVEQGRERVYVAFWLILSVCLFACPAIFASSGWTGVTTTDAGSPVSNATVALHSNSERPEYHAATTTNGTFTFAEIKPGSYRISVEVKGKVWTAPEPFVVPENVQLNVNLQLSSQDQSLKLLTPSGQVSTEATAGLRLSSKQVSSLPLNERDFSKLLLLAAGTMTDTNGAANFTQQFAVNGQRGVALSSRWMASIPPIRNSAARRFRTSTSMRFKKCSRAPGVMSAEIGHGAAGFTNVVTNRETNSCMAALFEFVRNAAFDARNFFDHSSRDRSAPHSSLCPQ